MERIPEFVANHLFLFALLVSILMLLVWNLWGAVMSGLTPLTPRESVRKINHEGAVLVDIRKPDSYSQGHILGATNIPPESIGTRQQEVAKYQAQDVILCCEHGNDSLRAARLFRAQGLNRLFFIKGGLQAWRNANLPLVKDS